MFRAITAPPRPTHKPGPWFGDGSGQAHTGAQVWYYRLKRACIRADGSRGLVVDVGGNFGWYSLFAAAMGCRVIAWEPVPHFRDFFKYGVAVNGFGHLIQVRCTP